MYFFWIVGAGSLHGFGLLGFASSGCSEEAYLTLPCGRFIPTASLQHRVELMSPCYKALDRITSVICNVVVDSWEVCRIFEA